MYVADPIEDLKSWMLYAQIDGSMRPGETKKELLWKFAEHYPLGELNELLQAQYVTQRRGDNSFISWITYHSKPLFGGLFRVPPDVVSQQCPDEGVLRNFIECLRSHGAFCPEYVAQRFGDYVILASLYLYYPHEFLPILSSDWLDRIIWTFSLERGNSFCDNAKVVYRMYQQTCGDVPYDAMAFVRLLDAYIGLSKWGDEKYGEYLSSIGYGAKEVERSKRELRLLAWMYSGGQISASEYKSKFNTEGFQREIHEYLKNHILSIGFEFHPRYTFSDSTKFWINYLQRKEVSRKKELIKGRRVSSGSFRQVRTTTELVDSLKHYGRGHEVYLHYTTLTGLLHVIGGIPRLNEKRMFRLTRGDDEHMNDQLEWKRLGSQDCWKRTFLMCFQTDENECAAMWGLYGKPDNEAIRLRLTNELLVNWIERVKSGQENVYAYCDRDQKYHKLATHQFEISLADVLYGGNVSDIVQQDVKKYIVGGIEYTVNPYLKSFETTREITGFIKSIDWSYEKETRIVFRLIGAGFEFDSADVKHIYIGCSTLPFEQIGYMTGPCVPEKLYDVYEETLCSRIPALAKSRISKSVYTNNLKFK